MVASVQACACVALLSFDVTFEQTLSTGRKGSHHSPRCSVHTERVLPNYTAAATTMAKSRATSGLTTATVITVVLVGVVLGGWLRLSVDKRVSWSITGLLGLRPPAVASEYRTLDDIWTPEEADALLRMVQRSDASLFCAPEATIPSPTCSCALPTFTHTSGGGCWLYWQRGAGQDQCCGAHWGSHACAARRQLRAPVSCAQRQRHSVHPALSPGHWAPLYDHWWTQVSEGALRQPCQPHPGLLKVCANPCC